MPRGGKRSAAPGTSLTNRTDLMTQPRAMPVTTIPGGQYGSQVASANAQKAVPMASGALPQGGPAPMAGAPGPGGPPAGPPGMAPPPAQMAGAMSGGGTLGSIIGTPTQRPDEHPMTGNIMGPGPGPEALTQSLPPMSPLLAVLAQLNNAGDLPPAARALHQAISATNGNQSAP